MAVLYVGAATEVEMKERKTEWMMCTLQEQLLKKALLCGGGVALVKQCMPLTKSKVPMKNRDMGIQIVKALDHLLYNSENAGVDGSVVSRKCQVQRC